MKGKYESHQQKATDCARNIIHYILLETHLGIFQINFTFNLSQNNVISVGSSLQQSLEDELKDQIYPNPCVLYFHTSMYTEYVATTKPATKDDKNGQKIIAVRPTITIRKLSFAFKGPLDPKENFTISLASLYVFEVKQHYFVHFLTKCFCCYASV